MNTERSPRPRLRRSSTNPVIAGDCGGIAEYLGVSAKVLRALVILSVLLPGPQVIFYIAAWILMPRG